MCVWVVVVVGVVVVCGGGGRGGGGVMVHSNKEKSLRDIAMVAKFLDLKYFRFFLQVWQKKTKILDMYDTSCAWLHSGTKQ